MLGSSAGLSDEELAWLNGWQESSLFDETDRLVLHYADSLTRDVTVSDELWDALAAHFSQRQIFELCFAVGLAALVNRIHATFHTDLDEATSNRVDAMELPAEIKPAPRH
jgi:alkylhydroperoxidase family enzyme